MFLGPYEGCMVHYKGGNVYCPGEDDCPASMHREQLLWKGYTAVDLWDKSLNHYLPMVLEVSESLEHQLRGRNLRGEVWVLQRKGHRNKKQITGDYTERRDSKSIRPAFDVLPIVRTLYHCSTLCLGLDNPVPSPTMLEAYLGAPPSIAFPDAGEEENKKIDPATREKLREEMRTAFGATRNGKTR